MLRAGKLPGPSSFAPRSPRHPTPRHHASPPLRQRIGSLRPRTRPIPPKTPRSSRRPRATLAARPGGANCHPDRPRMQPRATRARRNIALVARDAALVLPQSSGAVNLSTLVGTAWINSTPLGNAEITVADDILPELLADGLDSHRGGAHESEQRGQHSRHLSRAFLPTGTPASR
jgi:hypothetical protein